MAFSVPGAPAIASCHARLVGNHSRDSERQLTAVVRCAGPWSGPSHLLLRVNICSGGLALPRTHIVRPEDGGSLQRQRADSALLYDSFGLLSPTPSESKLNKARDA